MSMRFRLFLPLVLLGLLGCQSAPSLEPPEAGSVPMGAGGALELIRRWLFAI
ncbi:hypothetical protein [Rhodothermus marinus]|uniref:hypothetical protein n=1 Tax=Rhodothermus marinus TaxID=29549 RepID=UPI001FB43D79|nr:hypothetical protein [Rhodothermus marinus]